MRGSFLSGQFRINCLNMLYWPCKYYSHEATRYYMLLSETAVHSLLAILGLPLYLIGRSLSASRQFNVQYCVEENDHPGILPTNIDAWLIFTAGPTNCYALEMHTTLNSLGKVAICGLSWWLFHSVPHCITLYQGYAAPPSNLIFGSLDLFLDTNWGKTFPLGDMNICLFTQ